MSDDDIREAIRAFNRTFVEKTAEAVTAKTAMLLQF